MEYIYSAAVMNSDIIMRVFKAENHTHTPITYKQRKILPKDLNLNLPSTVISSELKQYHSAWGIIDKSVTT